MKIQTTHRSQTDPVAGFWRMAPSRARLFRYLKPAHTCPQGKSRSVALALARRAQFPHKRAKVRADRTIRAQEHLRVAALMMTRSGQWRTRAERPAAERGNVLSRPTAQVPDRGQRRGDEPVRVARPDSHVPPPQSVAAVLGRVDHEPRPAASPASCFETHPTRAHRGGGCVPGRSVLSLSTPPTTPTDGPPLLRPPAWCPPANSPAARTGTAQKPRIVYRLTRQASGCVPHKQKCPSPKAEGQDSCHWVRVLARRIP